VAAGRSPPWWIVGCAESRNEAVSQRQRLRALEEILVLNTFAAKSTLNLALTNNAATVRIATTSLDFARMSAQSTLNQTDDTLLLLIDDELVSVGTITVVSAGIYDLSILRARQGTIAAAHNQNVARGSFIMTTSSRRRTPSSTTSARPAPMTARWRRSTSSSRPMAS